MVGDAPVNRRALGAALDAAVGNCRRTPPAGPIPTYAEVRALERSVSVSRSANATG